MAAGDASIPRMRYLPGLRSVRRCLVAALLVSLAGAPKLVAQEGAAPDGLELRDRIVAVVDEDPILETDLRRVIGLGLTEEPAPGAGASGADREVFRRRVLDRLIEQRLRLHEIDRFGFQQLPVEQIEAEVERVQSTFADEAAFQRKLRELGLTPEALRQLLAQQIMVLIYVEERLGPRVFVTEEEIRAYYDDELGPEMRASGQTVPELGEVREPIRRVLRERRLNQEIEAWTAELRREADVQVYLDDPLDELPPVVDTLG